MLACFHWKRFVWHSVLLGSILVPHSSAFAEVITVKPGDTLGNLASQYQTTVDELRIANQLKSDGIFAGSSLAIPPRSTIYTVKPGDVLWKIADQNRTTIQKIMEINNIHPDRLNVGDKLLIPLPAPGLPQTSEQPRVETRTYKVAKGDDPWKISIAHGIPVTEFLQANGMTDSDPLMVGQQVNIPLHHIPLTATPGPEYGEYLDWFESAQYLFPIGAIATVTDFATKRQFQVKRTIGASHSDTEPLTAADAAIIKDIWGGSYSWAVRPVIVETNGRRIAASMASMPHDIEFIADNNFDGHFDIHFLNSLRHKDYQLDSKHQAAVKLAAGR